MKITPVIRREDFKTIEESKGFIAGSVTMLGIRIYGVKETKAGLAGIAALLFVFTNKLDEAETVFAQVLLDLEDEADVLYFASHPMNIKNMDPEFKANVFDEIIKGITPGENSYATNFDFREVIGVPLADSYYKFECIYSDNEKKTDSIRTIQIERGQFLQISQFMYWITQCYPIAPDIFLDPKFKKAKILQCTNMIFDGSTETVFTGRKMIMAHFTLYYKDGLTTKQHGFNVPCEKLEGKLERKPLLEDDYIKRFNKDDTVLADRIFVLTAPKLCSMMLTGISGENFYRFLSVDQEMAKRVHWLDWGKHIYMSKKEQKGGIIL